MTASFDSDAPVVFTAGLTGRTTCAAHLAGAIAPLIGRDLALTTLLSTTAALAAFTTLTIFAALLLKILFADLAAVGTIYRILSFAVAGAILLLASFGYARFTAKESKPES